MFSKLFTPKKVVLGIIDQCHSETDIVNYILLYLSLSLTLKYFIKKKCRRPGVFVTLWALALVLLCSVSIFPCYLIKIYTIFRNDGLVGGFAIYSDDFFSFSPV